MMLENIGFGFKKSKNITLVHVVSCKTATTPEQKCHMQTKPPFRRKKRCSYCRGAMVVWREVTEEFIRGKFLFGLNESFNRFQEDIFHRDGQRKLEDPPFIPAFVVNQVISFEVA